MEKLILSSASPRRKEIFTLLGLDFVAIPSDKEPAVDTSLAPQDVAMKSAAAKAEDIYEKNKGCTVVGADTVVALGTTVLGKPKDGESAKKMLKLLSGKCHEVLTAVYIRTPDGVRSFVEITEVEFYELSDKEIDSYVSTGEPLDKAGAYGIQGRGLRLVKRISGDYYNVVGFPAARFCRLMNI